MNIFFLDKKKPQHRDLFLDKKETRKLYFFEIYYTLFFIRKYKNILWCKKKVFIYFFLVFLLNKKLNKKKFQGPIELFLSPINVNLKEQIFTFLYKFLFSKIVD